MIDAARLVIFYLIGKIFTPQYFGHFEILLDILDNIADVDIVVGVDFAINDVFGLVIHIFVFSVIKDYKATFF